MITPTTGEIIQFVKSKLDVAAAANPYLDSMSDMMERWVRLWQPTQQDDSYKRPVFDSYAMIHSTQKDGASNPRYGWQAVLTGPLFESRKEFRSLRLAKVWVKQQMTVRCWPDVVQSEPDNIDARTINITFDLVCEGPLDKTNLLKYDTFR